MNTFAAAACALGAVLAPICAHASASTASEASTYTASSAAAPQVRDLNPAPGSTLKAFFPQFSARIDTHGGVPVRRESVHLYVDGTDVTSSASIDADTISYIPHQHLHAGWHDAFLEGSDAANRTFSDGWVFQTQSPDFEAPLNEQNFSIVRAGATAHRHAGFIHFFLFAPFDGVGLLQLCGFDVPFLRAGGAPVFFVTVPVTLGTALLGCEPEVEFTPFGIGQVEPIFFPLEIAGPSFFQNNDTHHRRRPLNALSTPAFGTYGSPAYRTTTMPAYPTTTMPVYRTPAVPVYGTSAMPLYRAPGINVPRNPGTAKAPPAAAGPPVKPVIPHPYVPH